MGSLDLLPLLTVVPTVMPQPVLDSPMSEGPWSVTRVLRCFRGYGRILTLWGFVGVTLRFQEFLWCCCNSGVSSEILEARWRLGESLGVFVRFGGCCWPSPIPSGPRLAPFKPSTLPFEDFDNHRLLKEHTWASVPGRKHSSDLINLNKNMGRKEALSQGLHGPAPALGPEQSSLVPGPGSRWLLSSRNPEAFCDALSE